MALNITTAAQATTSLDTLDRNRLGDSRRAGMLLTRTYLDGDHWQKGAAWGGPPIELDMAGAGETILALQKDLVPVPVIPEVIGRFVTGTLGHEPSFAVELQRELGEGQQPSPAERTDLTDLNDALTAFWDGCGAHEKAQEFAALLTMGRGVMRFVLPPEVGRAINEGGAARTRTLSETARAFDIDVPDWAQAGVVRDADSGEAQGVYRYDESQTDSNNNITTQNRAEVTLLDEMGRTLFRTIEDEVIKTETPYDCNGRLWILQATLPRPLIDEPQRALQRKIDFLNFILPKNAQYAGFRERHFLGVAKQQDANGVDIDPEIGPATVNYWQPAFYTDENGARHATAAQLILSEPVNSQPIRDDLAHLIQVLLKSCSQLHTVISGDAMASGVSRIQARAEFMAALLQLQPKIEKTLRDLLELVLCMACNLSGQGELLERYKSTYRLRVDLRLDVGPLSPEEKAQIIALKQAGLLSRETALGMLGIEDVGAEVNRLKEDEMGELGDGFPEEE